MHSIQHKSPVCLHLRHATLPSVSVAVSKVGAADVFPAQMAISVGVPALAENVAEVAVSAAVPTAGTIATVVMQSAAAPAFVAAEAVSAAAASETNAVAAAVAAVKIDHCGSISWLVLLW